jgi:hypothetical protein
MLLPQQAMMWQQLLLQQQLQEGLQQVAEH